MNEWMNEMKWNEINTQVRYTYFLAGSRFFYTLLRLCEFSFGSFFFGVEFPFIMFPHFFGEMDSNRLMQYTHTHTQLNDQTKNVLYMPLPYKYTQNIYNTIHID